MSNSLPEIRRKPGTNQKHNVSKVIEKQKRNVEHNLKSSNKLYEIICHISKYRNLLGRPECCMQTSGVSILAVWDVYVRVNRSLYESFCSCYAFSSETGEWQHCDAYSSFCWSFRLKYLYSLKDVLVPTWSQNFSAFPFNSFHRPFSEMSK